MKLVTRIAMLSLGLLTVGCSSAPRTPPPPVYYVDAMVLDISEAPEVCYQDKRKSGGIGKPLLGFLIGGIVGNQFGGGSGRILSTVAGAGIGTIIATDTPKPASGKYHCERNGYIAIVSYIHPVHQNMITERIPLERRSWAEFINIPVN
jgi:hypothetical protein